MDRKSKKHPAPIIEALEPRMMFSADIFGGAVDNPATDDSLASLLDDTAAVLEKQTSQLNRVQTEAALSESSPVEGDVTSSSEETFPRLELVFVDADTPDYQQLVDDLLSNSDNSRRFEVIVLDNNSDGVEQITSALQGHQGVNAIHLIAHGEDGAVDLGNTQLNNQNFVAYQAQLQSWANYLDTDADILFYGCDLAASENGQTLIDRIATFTGADIAASNDLTGNADLGGDWELEYSAGQIDARVAFSEQVQAMWQGTLSPALWLSTDSNVGPNNDNSPVANGLTSWTEGQVLEFSGTHGVTTSGSLSMVIDFDAFTIGTGDTDQTVDAGALHFVSRDITVGGANGTFDLKAGDVLVSFLQDETIGAAHSSTGADMRVHDQDLLVFRPDTLNDYSAGRFTVLLDDVVSDDLKGVTLIEQNTTIGGTDIAAGSFLLISETSLTKTIDLYVPTGVGAGATTGTTTPLIDLSNLGIEANSLRGIEVIEAATTIGGQSLIKGDVLATLNINDNVSGVGSDGLKVDQNDVFVLRLTSTGEGTTAGTASMFFDGSDVGLDNSPGPESPYALALYNYSQLVVDTVSDVADGNTASIKELLLDKGADGKISLREAILAANNPSNSDVTDVIRFNITDPLVSGVHTIGLGSALPTITDTLIIDGTSEPDFSGTPVIRIDGASAGANVDGLSFSATSDNSIVRGLMVTGFSRDGILVQAGADHLTFTGNWIGTSGAGSTGVGNGDDGIELIGSHATIGGTNANEGNVITNAGDEGINIAGTGVTAHLIQGNYIGLDPDGVSGSGNTDVGIAIISGSGNNIGGTTASARNVISNNFEGIEVNTSNNIFQGNYIGTDASGTLDRGNRSDDGIEIQSSATGNLIGGTQAGAGNLIAFNALDGINIVNGNGNTVLGNQIHSNGDMGIDLGTSGVTSSDANDGDIGANNLQNYPVITAADLTGTNLTLSGILDTDGTNTSYRIEFFGNAIGTQDATNGEARFFLGSTTLTTDVNGDAAFNDVLLSGVALSEGDYVTATATKVDDAGQVGSDDQLAYGDTSEFAANVVIANGNNAPVLSGANDLNSINEDDVNNSGTLVSGLIAGQVSDADSGSSGGIAVVGVDNTNGTWEFTTNGGGIWTAFGSPSTAAARLLAGDVNTLVRFVPDADWNGTVTNGITFRAWDQTSGANGSSMAIDEGTRFTLDEFSSVSYSNNDGTNAWSTDWAEVDSSSAGSDPTDGRIRVSGNELKFQVASAGNSLSREVNLENATGATLSFSYDNALGGSATLLAQVSSDGGTSYDTVATFNSTINQGVGTQTIDLSSHLSSNTLVRFYVSGGETGAGINNLSIDNVQVEYTELGGGSSPFSSTTASASVVVNAMADTPSVTNTSTTEDTQSTSGLVITPNPADGSEVTHYKVTGITDGTLYKNDGVTQINNGDFITVAEGSAGLKFTPTADFNGSGIFTIQASTSNSDAGLGGGTTVATVNVAPVNDAPTDLITTSTSQSGLSLNEDGNDSYLVADNGLPSPLSQFTVEVQFEGNNFSNEVPFISYNTASGDVLAINTMADNTLELDIGTGAVAFSNAINYNATLMDGQRHTLSVSWDNSAGDWSVYIDGALIDSGTGLSTGQTIPTGGTLMFGLEQDSVGGTFESQEYFNGELYDIRLFDDVRTATEVATNYTQTLPSNEPGMVANWIFDNLSTSGTIVESVGGNNLTVQHTSGTGFTPSNPELILSSPENSPNGTVVGTLSTIDPDRGDSFSYTLVDNAGGRFDIDSVSGDITVLDASLIDYETAASHNITVRVTDAGGLSYDEIFTIQVTDTNEAPVLDSAALTLIEGQTVGLSAANFGITDPDDTEFTFTISGLNGGYFQLSNNANVPITSFTSAQLNSGLVEFVDDGNEVMPAFDVTVNDGALDSNILAATISYTGVNDAATISVTAADTAVTEDDAGNNTATGTVTISDPDTGEGTLASSTATYGTVTVDGSGNWTYALNNGDPAVQALAAGETLTDTITFTSDDGTTQTQAITITGANDAAVIGGDASAAVSEDGTLTDSGALTISDADSGEAVFVAQSSAASSNGYGTVDLDSAGNWTYNLDNSNATVQALAEGQTLTDSFTATSADGSTQVVNVTITGKDDATTISVTSTDTVVTEDDASNNTANGTVTVTDPDTGQGTLASSAAIYGTVTVDGSGNWTYALDNSNASVQALAAGETLADTITFTSDDGSTQTQNITITGTNDAAVIGGDASAAVSEDGIVSDTGALTISDADSGEAVFVAQSSAASSNGYGTVDLDSAGNWTYNLDNSNATVQALAEGQTLTDSFTATSADGSTQVVNVTITGKDDATNITVTAADAAVTEDDAGNNTANGSVTVSDPDTGQGTLASSTANYGTVTVDGSGNWTYALNNGDPAVQALAAGETLTDTITFTSDDGTTQTQAITITGANDAAVIGGDASAAVSEDGTLTDSGALTISDADSGEAVFLAQSSAASTNGYGTVDLDSAGNWTYSLDNSNATVQALAEGQTLTDSFTATSADGSTQVVNVTITGKDDATTISVTSTDTVVTEDDASNNTANGTVTVTDPDTGQGTLASSTANYGTVTVDGSGNWTYALDNSNASVQALAAGDTLADTITFTSDDGSTQTQNITITGTNDAAVIGGDASAAVSEDGIVSDTGALTISDADSGEAVFVAQSSAASSNGYGTVDLDSAGNWTYNLDNSNATVQALAEGQTLTDNFTATSADGSTQVVNVTITGKDDATNITVTAADAAVTEDDAGNNTANGSVTVSDPDTGQGTLASSTANYGTVTVDGSGNWTYALNNGDPAVQALAAGETLTDTITFTSDDGTTQTQTITITGTNDAAVIGGDTTAAVSEDGILSDSGTLTISDADSDEAVFVSQTSAPSTNGYGTVDLDSAGNWTYSLDNSNATVQALAEGQTLTDSFTATSADGSTQVVNVTITGKDDATNITVTAADAAVTEDDAGNNTANGTVTVTDPDTGQGTLASSTANYGTVTVDGSGNWTYALDNSNASVQALAAGETLADTITFTSDDGSTQTQAITITGTNDAAVIGGDASAAVSEDGILSDTGALTISDADSGEAVFVAQSSAASTNGYGTVDLDSAGNWTYNLDNTNATVQALSEGETLTDSFTATSADGSTQVVNVTITGKDDATNITVTAADSTVTEDDAGNNTATGTVTISDPDTGEGTLASSTANYGTVTVDGSGNWTYALDNSNASVQALAAGETLADTITFTSDDGTTQTQAITITGANDAAVIGGDASAAVSEDGIVSDTGALTISDADSGEAVFVAQSSAASTNGYGTVDLDSAGNWTYNLDNTNATVQALSEGETLTDSFTATSADGATQVVTVTITGKDDTALISGGTNFSGNEGDSATGNLNATDLEGLTDGTYFTVTAQATNGTASINPETGAWRFTPANGDWFGTDRFTVTVTDDKGGTTQQVISIVLANVNDAPVSTPVTLTPIAEDSGARVITQAELLANSNDVDGDTLKVNGLSVSSGSGRLVENNDGTWSFTPSTNWNGEVSFSFDVSDGTTAQASSAILAVSPVNDAPVEEGVSSEPVVYPSVQVPIPEPEQDADQELAAKPTPETRSESDGAEGTESGPVPLDDQSDITASDLQYLSPIDDVALAESLTEVYVVTETYDYANDQHELPPPKTLDLLNLNLTPFQAQGMSAVEMVSPIKNSSFAGELDDMKRELDEVATEQSKQAKFRTEAMVGATMGLSVGFISWVLRAGSLMAGFMSVTPLWRQLDPMPILGADDDKGQEKESEREAKEDGRKVEEIFADDDPDH